MFAKTSFKGTFYILKFVIFGTNLSFLLQCESSESLSESCMYLVFYFKTNLEFVWFWDYCDFWIWFLQHLYLSLLNTFCSQILIGFIISLCFEFLFGWMITSQESRYCCVDFPYTPSFLISGNSSLALLAVWLFATSGFSDWQSDGDSYLGETGIVWDSLT